MEEYADLKAADVVEEGDGGVPRRIRLFAENAIIVEVCPDAARCGRGGGGGVATWSFKVQIQTHLGAIGGAWDDLATT